MQSRMTLCWIALLLAGCPASSAPSDGVTGSDGEGTGHDTTGTGGPASSTSGGTTSTSVAEDSGDEESGLDPSFVAPPDGGGSTIECSVWEQDCPDGEKCMPWANDGGFEWNATKCAPVAGDPNEPGDPCIAEGGGLLGEDDCALGSMCWNVIPDTGTGTCVGLCSGSPENPMCEVAETSCSISNDGVLTLCLQLCDPLLQNCSSDEACYAGVGTNDFFCSPNVAPEGLGNYGDPCEFINVCNPGLFCAIPEAVPECASSGCCSEFCDTSIAEAQCTGEGQECVPYWEKGQAPPAYENVGVCLLPF